MYKRQIPHGQPPQKANDVPRVDDMASTAMIRLTAPLPLCRFALNPLKITQYS